MLFLAWLAVSGGAGAEDPLRALGESWTWRIFDRQEGLASNSVSLLYQDRYDYIYAATERAICRYDSWEWEVLANEQPFDDGEVLQFVESSNALFALTANAVWKVQGGTTLQVFYRSSGILAASSRDGQVFVIDPKQGKHLQIRGEIMDRLDPELRLPTPRILDYRVDAGLVHWLATMEGLYFRDLGRRVWKPILDRDLEAKLVGLRCTRFFSVRGFRPPGGTAASSVPPRWEELWGLFESPRGQETSAVLARLEEGAWRFMAQLEGSRIRSITTDSLHDYYASGEDGRLHFSSDGREWKTVESLGLGKVAIYGELLDTSGRLWFRIGTGGIAAFHPDSLRWRTIPSGIGQPFPNVLSVLETAGGEIWMGLTRGLSRYREGSPPETFEKVWDVPLHKITGLAEDDLQRIWISSESFQGAFCYQDGAWVPETAAGLGEHPVRRIVRDRLGELWFLSQESTEEGDHIIYHSSLYTAFKPLPVSVPAGPVNDILRTQLVKDQEDVFWIATDEGLLVGTFREGALRIDKKYNEQNGLRSGRIPCLAEGPDGGIWLGYPGAGAGVTRIRGDTVTHFDQVEGLASCEVWAIASSGQNVWVGTDRGLTRFDGDCWYSYSIASADPRTSRVLAIFVPPKDGRSALIGTWGQGAVWLRLDDTHRPRFRRSSFPDRVEPPGDVVFSWEARDYRNETPPDALLFRHRLDRKSWSPFTRSRRAEFTGLQQGEHEFEVEVRDLDGNRNRGELVHKFKVIERSSPWAFWVTSGAGIFLMVLGLALVYGRHKLVVLRRRRRYARFFGDYPSPVFVMDEEGRVVDYNGAPIDPEGVKPGDILGRPLELLPVFAGKEVRSALKSLLGGETIRLRFSRWEGDGRERVYDLRGFPLRRRRPLHLQGSSPAGGEGEARRKARASAVVILEDCTIPAVEGRLLERSRRLASLRSLAGRISLSAGDFLRRVLSDEAIRARRDLCERAERLDAVLQGLGKFSAPVGNLSAVQPLLLNEFLEELAVGSPGGREEAPRFRPGGNVRVDFRGQPGLWNVSADRSALAEALLEVLKNASEAVPEKGTISIRTSNVRLESDPGLPASGPYVEITVKDTGPGMDPTQLEQVLEPFYSTKPKDSSLGLGLSLAYGIARAYGGDLRVESQPGQGTTVRILLPARIG